LKPTNQETDDEHTHATQSPAGWHSKLEVGTGEAMVDQVVAMLDVFCDAAPPQRLPTSQAFRRLPGGRRHATINDDLGGG
jgi:hypothetical protein